MDIKEHKAILCTAEYYNSIKEETDDGNEYIVFDPRDDHVTVKYGDVLTINLGNFAAMRTSPTLVKPGTRLLTMNLHTHKITTSVVENITHGEVTKLYVFKQGDQLCPTGIGSSEALFYDANKPSGFVTGFRMRDTLSEGLSLPILDEAGNVKELSGVTRHVLELDTPTLISTITLDSNDALLVNIGRSLQTGTTHILAPKVIGSNDYLEPKQNAVVCTTIEDVLRQVGRSTLDPVVVGDMAQHKALEKYKFEII